MRKSALLIIMIMAIVLGGCNLLNDTPAPATPVAQVPPKAATPITANPASATAIPAPLNGTGRQTDVVQVVQRVGPAVVTVVNQLGADSFSGMSSEALGTGVIVDSKGYIVTNNHVVEGQQSLTVIYADGKRAENVRLVGADSRSDIAVLQVDGTVPAIAALGDSEAIMPGETVIAIGSALGDFRNSVTVGVISGVHRTITGDSTSNSIEDMIQTDAAINHGNSGGPLINLDGQIIGINTAIVRGTGFDTDIAEGLGFAIPSNTVKSISDQLISKGHVSRAYLGVTTLAITSRIATAYNLHDESGNPLDYGAYVRQVRDGSPAAAAGIQIGDIITNLGDFRIDAEHPFGTTVTKFNPGDSLKVRLIRSGSVQQVTATLIER